MIPLCERQFLKLWWGLAWKLAGVADIARSNNPAFCGRMGSGYWPATSSWGTKWGVQTSRKGMILWLKNRNCLALFSKSLPEEDAMLQVVISELLPVALNNVAVLHMLIKQVMLVPLSISSGFLLESAPGMTGDAKMTCDAVSCSDRALIYRLKSLFGLGLS